MGTLPFQLFMLSDDKMDDKKHLFELVRSGFFFCTSGHITVTDGRQTCHLCRGHLYIRQPFTPFVVLECDDGTDGFVMSCSLDYILPIVSKVLSVESILYIRANPCVYLPDRQCTHVEQTITILYERINAAFQAGELPALRQELYWEILKSSCQALCYEILYIYFGQMAIHALPQGKKETIFQNFVMALYRYYKQERNVAFYASLQHLSERYFSSVIKEQSGNSASFWIIQLVITEAKRLLETSSMSIKEIAFHLHFPTQSFFGKYFKHYTGVSPQAYRRQMSEKA